MIWADSPCGCAVLGCLAKEESHLLESLCESVFGSHGSPIPLNVPSILPSISVNWFTKGRGRGVTPGGRLGQCVYEWMARRCEVKAVLTKFKLVTKVTYKSGASEGSVFISASQARQLPKLNQIPPTFCPYIPPHRTPIAGILSVHSFSLVGGFLLSQPRTTSQPDTSLCLNPRRQDLSSIPRDFRNPSLIRPPYDKPIILLCTYAPPSR